MEIATISIEYDHVAGTAVWLLYFGGAGVKIADDFTMAFDLPIYYVVIERVEVLIDIFW